MTFLLHCRSILTAVFDDSDDDDDDDDYITFFNLPRPATTTTATA